MVYGHEDHTDNDHCQGQPKIKLYKPHPVMESLSGGGKKGDGTGLGGHYGQSDRPPPGIVSAKDIRVYIFASLCFPNPIKYNKKQGSGKYYPIYGCHIIGLKSLLDRIL